MNAHELQLLDFMAKSAAEAVVCVQSRRYQLARDNCIKIKAYSDLYLVSTTKNCVMFEFISSLMCKLSNEIASIPESDAAIITEPTTTAIPTTTIEDQIAVKFSDIVGNERAKQAMFESIVFPFSLESSMKDRLYNGIRKASSNVMLYGPPG